MHDDNPSYNDDYDAMIAATILMFYVLATTKQGIFDDEEVVVPNLIEGHHSS